MTSYYGWVPPTLAEAQFTNCTAAASWLTAYLSTGNADGTLQYRSSLGFAYTYLVSLVPSSITEPTVGQAMQWYTSMDSDGQDYLEQMINFPLQHCPSEVCQSLSWDGDGDLAGIGVMVVYYLAAALSTIYFVLLAARGLYSDKKGGKVKLWPWLEKLLDAFDESLGAFLDAALLFCISMLVAGTYRHGSSRIHPDKTHSLYWLTNATYMAMFTIFPALLLQITERDPLVTARNEARKKARDAKEKEKEKAKPEIAAAQTGSMEKTKALATTTPKKPMGKTRLLYWFLVFVFTVTNVALYYTLKNSDSRLNYLLYRDSANVDVVWESDCEPRALRRGIQDAMIVGEALLGINLFVWAYQLAGRVLGAPEGNSYTGMHNTVVGLVRFQMGGRSKNDLQDQAEIEAWNRIVRVWRLANGVLCCAVMWALLGLFTGYRLKVEENMGGSDEDGQWSFGQVLALATWVPVAIDLLTELSEETVEPKTAEQGGGSEGSSASN